MTHFKDHDGSPMPDEKASHNLVRWGNIMARLKTSEGVSAKAGIDFSLCSVQAAVWKNTCQYGRFYTALLSRSFLCYRGEVTYVHDIRRAAAGRPDDCRRGTAMNGRPAVAANELTILKRRLRFIRGRRKGNRTIAAYRIWQPYTTMLIAHC